MTLVTSVLLRGQESGQDHMKQEWEMQKAIFSFREELNDHETLTSETHGKLAQQQLNDARFHWHNGKKRLQSDDRTIIAFPFYV